MVQEVTKEIDGEECVFWSFRMREYNRGTLTYWMVTLEDADGRLYVQFHRTEDSALYALRHFHLHSGSLYMPWAVFERAARALLDEGDGATKRMPSKGSFTHQGSTICYTTTCGEYYYITPEELEGLLA